MKVTWSFDTDRSIWIRTDGQRDLHFASIEELDEFDDALVEARNEIADAIEEQQNDE